MDANKEFAESAKRQIEIAEQKYAETELGKTIKLSQKAIWIAIILSLFIPITGYIYTRRWKTMLIVFSCVIGAGVAISASSENKEEAGTNSFAFSSIVSPIIATIDNGVAVHKAKKSKAIIQVKILC